jgi:glycosyltransferase involved in cell wall biosynthesis
MLAAGLPKNEFDVHVCALTRGGPLAEKLDEAEIPYHVIGKRLKADPIAWWQLRSHIKSLRPDLVHTWIYAADVYGRTAAITCGVKTLVTGLRCVDPWKSGSQLAIDRRLARRTARLVANSQGVKDFYVEKGLPAEKIDVIQNAIDPLPPTDLTRDALLDEVGITEENGKRPRLVGLVGRLWPQKRVKDAIWSTDLLKVARGDVHLLIMGDGPQRDQLMKYRDQVEIRDRVHFLGERADVGRIVPLLDMLWSSSGYEGQSNAIMEAMSTGVPVVASDIPGTRDLITHGKTGLLFPVGDRAALAKEANGLLKNPDLARQIGEAGRTLMVTEFAVPTMLDRYATLYRQLFSRC